MFRWTIPMRRGATVPARPVAGETLLLASDTSGWTVRGDMLLIDGQPASEGEHRAEFADGILAITTDAQGTITDWQAEPLPDEEEVPEPEPPAEEPPTEGPGEDPPTDPDEPEEV